MIESIVQNMIFDSVSIKKRKKETNEVMSQEKRFLFSLSQINFCYFICVFDVCVTKRAFNNYQSVHN